MAEIEKEAVTDENLEETQQGEDVQAAEDNSAQAKDSEACEGDPVDKKEEASEEQPDIMDAEFDEKGDKKRFFGKKKDKKDKQIDDLNAQIADMTDRIRRNMAEFDNFRKRTEKEKSSMFDMGAKSVVEKLLPIIDNFERGFSGVSEEQMKDPFVSGMDMVYKQLQKALTDMGVEPIEAVGKPFDPNLHNAVMHVEDENLGENTVAQEFQKGYLYHGTVVRHSMVQVAN